MRATAYCMFIDYRSWTTEGHVFSTQDERKAALRKLVEDEEDDVPEDATDDDLVELLGQHEHEVHLFDGDITYESDAYGTQVEPTDAPRGGNGRIAPPFPTRSPQ